MTDEPNEIVATAKAAKDRKDAAESAPEASRNWPVAAFGVGVGVGSAAVAAAMLFANRQRSKK